MLLLRLPASFQGWRSLDQIFMPSFAFYGKDICSINNNDNNEGCQQTNWSGKLGLWLALRRWLSRGCWPDCTSHPLHKTYSICAAALATGWCLIYGQLYTVFIQLHYIPSLDLYLFCILRDFFFPVKIVCDVLFSILCWQAAVRN